MAGTRICKVCGKEYDCCKAVTPVGQYRWQDVACCPEHGAIYLDRVLVARGLKAKSDYEDTKTETKAVKQSRSKKSSHGDIGDTVTPVTSRSK